MKLKNLIKKPQKQKLKEIKTFHTTIKSRKKHVRIDQKAKNKSNKKAVVLWSIVISLFGLVAALSAAAYVYNSFIIKSFDSGEIISPGEQNIIQLDVARQILIDKNIDVQKLEYGSGSAALNLQIEDGPAVYFSESLIFEKQADILSRILSSLKNEGKNARIVDLRYNRPIVKY